MESLNRRRLTHKHSYDVCSYKLRTSQLDRGFVVVEVALSLEAVVPRYIKRDRGFLPAAERTNKVKSNLNKKPRKIGVVGGGGRN